VTPSPFLFCVSYLIAQARQRAQSARAGQPESGALSLEWIVIAGILVAAALAAGIMFNNAVSKFASKLGG
jgi:hypothetical protein